MFLVFASVVLLSSFCMLIVEDGGKGGSEGFIKEYLKLKLGTTFSFSAVLGLIELLLC